VVPREGFEAGLTGLAGGFLVLRAFSSGCAALTGVEAISNGVPAFQKPKSRNAATTLLLLGLISASMMLSVITLARLTGIKYVEDPAEQLLLAGQPVGEEYHQSPVIGQIAATVFSGFPVMFYLVTFVTGLILVLAANTAFNGFPVLGSVLARDGFLPRQLHTRGDRLAYSNGITMLTIGAIALIVAFDAQVTRLIQLYIVGVFISFTTSQLGMVRHWTRKLRTEYSKQERIRMQRSRVVNSIGFGMTGIVLVIVLITKAPQGAWITLLLMALLFVTMLGIHTHYDRVAEELRVADAQEARALPSRTHGVVLISKLHQPALRAIAYARATRPNTLEAVHVAIDDDEVTELRAQWDEISVPVPLTILSSPYREITRPIVEYIRGLRRSSPRDLVVVFIPEYVVTHWWEQLLHNQSALRLKGRRPVHARRRDGLGAVATRPGHGRGRRSRVPLRWSSSTSSCCASPTAATASHGMGGRSCSSVAGSRASACVPAWRRTARATPSPTSSTCCSPHPTGYRTSGRRLRPPGSVARASATSPRPPSCAGRRR
jgi:hypothetical protein